VNIAAAYRLPQPWQSEAAARRYDDEDLAEMSTFRLWTEKTAVAAALACLVHDDRDPILVTYPQVVTQQEWLRRRYHAVCDEMRRRKARR